MYESFSKSQLKKENKPVEIEEIGEKIANRQIEETEEEKQQKDYDNLVSLCETCEHANRITFKHSPVARYANNDEHKYMRCSINILNELYGPEKYYNGEPSSEHDHKLIKCNHYEKEYIKIEVEERYH